MDLDKSVKLWILVCGKQFGINTAEPYLVTDESTRQNVKYCTYRYDSMQQTNLSALDNNSSANGYDATIIGEQEWRSTIRIDLYNSPNGMYELASLCVGAQVHQQIRQLFDEQDCAFVICASLTDETDFSDNSNIEYHHSMLVEFNEYIENSLTIEGEVVEQILTKLNIIGIDL